MFKLPTIKSTSFTRRGRLALAAGSGCVCYTMSNASSASARPKYTPRMQQILQHLENNPQTLKSVPMMYSSDAQAPVPEVAQGLTPADVAPTEKGAQTHMARVVCALVSVAFGALDAAHNAVTPLSWGAPTEFAGPPIPGSPAAKEAAYVHALVHRWEGSNVSEFGTGFNNSNYWYCTVGHHKVMDQLQAAAVEEAGGREQLLRYVGGPRLETSRLVALCEDAQEASADPALTAFANKVVNIEWRLLLDWCSAHM